MGFEQVWSVALDANPWWLLASLLPTGLRFVVWSAKWRNMLLRAVKVSHYQVLIAVLAGAFVNLVTPTAKLGGGIVRSLIVHRATGLRKSVAYGWSLADQITNSLGNAGLFAILAMSTFWTLDNPESRFVLFSAGVVPMILIAAFFRYRASLWRSIQSPQWRQKLFNWVPERLRQKSEPDASGQGLVDRILYPLLCFSSNRQTASDLCLGACSFASLCIANAMVFKALGSDASILAITNAVVLGYFAGTATGAMGGIGATEFFLIQLYSFLGVEPTLATAAALLHRVSYYGVTLLFGSAAMIISTSVVIEPVADLKKESIQDSSPGSDKS